MPTNSTHSRVLSGIQPTGRFHWGNYFGAIRQYIDLQTGQDSAFYFIANLHALTTVHDPAVLAKFTLDAAIDLLALGLDPDRATLFVQSDVPEVSELCWLLTVYTPLGLLERCHAYKDKKARGLRADTGLLMYPVLMAADILLYDAALVPVGEDQVQHLEVCRDIAGAINHRYGEILQLPQPKVLESAGRVVGTDGEKMSKSYGNTIEIFEDLTVQKKKIMGIKTDSRPLDEPKDPETDHLFALLSLFASPSQREEAAALYRRGGFGYGTIKKQLVELAAEYFAPARERRKELESQPERIRQILGDGAARARAQGRQLLDKLHDAIGICRTERR